MLSYFLAHFSATFFLVCIVLISAADSYLRSLAIIVEIFIRASLTLLNYNFILEYSVQLAVITRWFIGSITFSMNFSCPVLKKHLSFHKHTEFDSLSN